MLVTPSLMHVKTRTGRNQQEDATLLQPAAGPGFDLLDGLTADGEKYEGRSVAFLTKMAVRAFLQNEGKVDDKGRPLPPA